MIWVGGRVVPDGELAVSVLDRTFEHGLGLFETMRTWNGRAILLDRHLARLSRSAEALGIPLDPPALPGAGAVSDLLAAVPIDGNALLRITVTGGLSESGWSTVWMRAFPLPPRLDKPGADLDLYAWRTDRDDPLARHKSLNFWRRRLAYSGARQRGFDEVVSQTDDDRFWEGSRTSLFLVAGGTLITPSLDGPIVPGVMRSLVLERSRMLPLEIDEPPGITLAELRAADEVFLTNSVRGLIPVASAGDLVWESPGPVCLCLERLVTEWSMIVAGAGGHP